MKNIDQILNKVLSGSADSNDFLILNDWLYQNEENQKEFKRLVDYWNADVHYSLPSQALPSYERVWSNIKHEEKKKSRRVYRLSIPWAVAAACFILVCVLGYLSTFQWQKSSSDHYYTYMSGNARNTIRLKDGSVVTLNKNSYLTCSENFDKKKREVKLQGEAFFSVAKDKSHPFTVIVNHSKIKVLGTKFNVTAIRNNKVIVTLVEGSICFMSGNKEKIMKPNQQLLDTPSGFIVKSVDVDSVCAWKSGLLKFKSIELAELIRNMENRFGVKILMKNASLIDTMKVTASFRENQPLEDILNIIAGSFPVRWKKEGKLYVIKVR